MSTQSGSRHKEVGPRGKWIWMTAVLAVAAVVVGAVIYFGLLARAQALLQRALEQIKQLGPWGPILFILLYIVSCVALVPGSVLTMGGGTLFGVVLGSIYVSIAATLGATAAFLIGRYLARDWVTRKIGAHPAFVAIDKSVAEEGWRIVFLTRLCPIFPFFLLNYGYGLTRVSLRDYVLATWLGIIPASTLFVYIGSLARVEGQQAGSVGWAWKGFILITAVVSVAYITKVARRALTKKIGPPESKSTEADR
jgi:uncharacterized membrane protein YdjX (TVP38/TMEM64 family)